MRCVRANKDCQLPLIQALWFFLRSGRNQQLLEAKQELHIALEQAQLQELIWTPGTDSLTDWKELAERVTELSEACLDVRAYFSSLSELQGERALEEVAKNQMRLTEAMADNSK